MITVPVGEFKANFSQYLKEVEKGEKITISYGRKKQNIAILSPIEVDEQKAFRKLGTLRDKGGKAIIMPDWEMTDEDLLNEKLYT